MDRYCKRLIEVDFPVRRVSANARREGTKGHISTLHTWWARRPLAACRAVLCASLWPDPGDELCPGLFRSTARALMSEWAKSNLRLMSPESMAGFVRIAKDPHTLDRPDVLRTALLDFIADFSSRESSSSKPYLKTARQLTAAAHQAFDNLPGKRPLVIDPFAGGGAIPVEALRLAADTFAADLNPVAALVNKVQVEYIPEFRQALSSQLRHWGQHIHDKAAEALAPYYPGSDGAAPIAYLWARTITCEGPSCGCEIPVTRSMWIDRSSAEKSALRFSYNSGALSVDVIHNPGPSDVEEPTSRRGSVTCPSCSYTTPRKHVEKQSNEAGLGQRLLAIVESSKNGRRCRNPNTHDFAALEEARKASLAIAQDVPDEPLPYLRSIFNVHIYGMHAWGDLFSDRQKLYLVTLARIVRDLDFSTSELNDNEQTALRTLLAFLVDKAAAVSCSLARWRADKGRLEGAFAMQALPMVWDWGELNPFNVEMMPFSGFVNGVASVVESLGGVLAHRGTSAAGSATDLPLADDSAALLFTDPPYYDAIPYANLSDFFYVWLRRTLGHEHPELLRESETPKDNEIVQLSERNQLYRHKTKQFFEENMTLALADARRVCHPGSVGCIVFAHKTTTGWEAFLQAVIDAGWVVTASWPIDTELTTRFKAIGTASLASSIHLICRPRENEDGELRHDLIGDWRAVLAELPVRIHEWLPRLAEEGVVGADAIFACLGPALETFTRYSSVEKASGERVALGQFLEEIWAAVSREALSMIFEGADASGFEEDARLTAMWLWTIRTATNGDQDVDDEPRAKVLHGYGLEYDAARKIAQGLGAHLDDLHHLVEVKGDAATLLSSAARTKYLFGSSSPSGPKKRPKKKEQLALNFSREIEELEEENADWAADFSSRPEPTVLDQVHQAMILFGASRSEALRRLIVDEGVGNNPLFWRLAQALSALYPGATEEKRWIDGVLARKKGLGF